MKLLLVISTALTMIGCSVFKEQPSPIVQKAEACGSGDISRASFAAVQDWFGKHRDCAVKVDVMCAAVRQPRRHNGRILRKAVFARQLEVPRNGRASDRTIMRPSSRVGGNRLLC